jgi:hypothetical protein
MRALIPLALALALAPTAAADEPAEARAVIDKAVMAAGGEAKLAGAKTFSQKAAGKFFGPSGTVSFTGEWVVNLPEQVRETVDSESDGMKFHAVKVIAPDKGWLRVNMSVEELDKDALAADRNQLYAAYLTTLLPLKEKEYVLAPLGESKVGERAAVGVKVTRPDRPDVSLFFDNEKGWLLRVELSVKVGNAKVRQEVLYDDYQDAGGLMRPKKTTVKRDGKVVVESEVTEFKPLDKVDAKFFDKP